MPATHEPHAPTPLRAVLLRVAGVGCVVVAVAMVFTWSDGGLAPRTPWLVAASGVLLTLASFLVRVPPGVDVEAFATTPSASTMGRRQRRDGSYAEVVPEEDDPLSAYARNHVGEAYGVVVVRLLGEAGDDPSARAAMRLRARREVAELVPDGVAVKVREDCIAFVVGTDALPLVAPLVVRRVREGVAVDLGEPVDVRGGVAVHPFDAQKMRNLLRRAAAIAKRGGEVLAYVDPLSLDRARVHTSLSSELRSAIRGDGVVAWYQPVCSSPSMRVVGAEALARWLHPRDGMLPARTFVPMAEGRGVAIDLGTKIAHLAARAVAHWRTHHVRQVFVAINLSGTELRDAWTAEQVEKAVKAAGLPPRVLRVDVPAAVLEQRDPAVLQTVERLAHQGVQVWAESTDHLPRLERMVGLSLAGFKVPASQLLTAVDEMRPEADAWFQQVAHADRPVHVTRVETATQVRRFRLLGIVRYQQGFALVAPLPPSDLPRVLGRKAVEVEAELRRGGRGRRPASA